MRLRDQVIGALNLFRAVPGAFDPADIRIGQALADVATISLVHERSMRHSDTVNEQLQTALNSRVIIEQAKGKLAERLDLDMDRAFGLLRAGRAPLITYVASAALTKWRCRTLVKDKPEMGSWPAKPSHSRDLRPGEIGAKLEQARQRHPGPFPAQCAEEGR